MENAVAVMSNTVTPDALWGQVGTAMPFVATMIIFAFGFYIVRRVLKKPGKGKAGI